jgi:AcrR family transcriptional regulator
MADQDVRERILGEATRLFAERGYGGASVREIVQAAGVTKPVLYYHFGNKEGLFLETVRTQMNRLGQVMGQAVEAPGTVPERLLRFLQTYLDWLTNHQDVLKLLVACRHNPDDRQPEVDMMSMHRQHGQIVAGLLAEGIADGSVRGDIELSDLVMGLIGMANIFCMARMFAAIPADSDHPQRILDLYLNGAAPQ